MNGFIYKISNYINDKVYIGKTLLPSIEQRFEQHKKDSKREHLEKRPLYYAMNKYGVENFYIELIEEVPIENLAEKEKYWINFYKSYGKDGYNATFGGDGKQIYNYDDIVKSYLNGKTIKEVSIEFQCSSDTVSHALSLSGIDSYLNSWKNIEKGIIAKNLEEEIIQVFPSRIKAVQWLIEQGYTKTTDTNNITACIGRAANGKRHTAYGFIWENI